MPPVPPVEESPAPAPSLNDNCFGSFMELLHESEIDQVVQPVGFTLQADGRPRFFDDHECMDHTL